MKTLQLLELDDAIHPDDWIRPLTQEHNQFGDTVAMHSFNMYGGTPQNNIKWIRVRDFFGKCHWGKTLGQINSLFDNSPNWQNQMLRYEVVRGDMPTNHVWDWRKAKQNLLTEGM